MTSVTLEDTLVIVGKQLKSNNYEFTTISPNSHQRILKRHPNNTGDATEKDPLKERMRQIFGWNLNFKIDLLPEAVTAPLRREGLLLPEGGNMRSAVRFSTHRHMMFAHTSFPTVESDSIFFGPDTYRYFNFIEQAVERFVPAKHKSSMAIIDIGAGSGAGGLFLADLLARRDVAVELVLSDINPKALEFSKANARINNLKLTTLSCVKSNVLKDVVCPETFDFIISNPPYMVEDEGESKASISDGSSRLYRDGGGALGLDLALRILREGLAKLSENGILALYTGVPIVKGGRDVFAEDFRREVAAFNSHRAESSKSSVEILRYEEMDPDVWGEELETKSYSEVERIAVVGLTLRLRPDEE
eukprot:TRINITY_DN7761_c0_g1_i1.p1 TRINITY_DN7761_c0_g1~~TRINITY_DN7761_c0_g1_i1.p1  ORF type:complete len:361 (+),score=76.98 TRINITY_DN7761_c0_g1_i1:93-1175(+)